MDANTTNIGLTADLDKERKEGKSNKIRVEKLEHELSSGANSKLQALMEENKTIGEKIQTESNKVSQRSTHTHGWWSDSLDRRD